MSNKIVTELEDNHVVMTIDGIRWILLGVKKEPLASSLTKRIEAHWNAPAHIGLPIDPRKSVAEGRLIWHTESGATGIYVREDCYQRVFDAIGDQM